MHSYIFWLGSHPTLSATEVWAALSRDGLQPRVHSATDSLLRLELSAPLPDDFIDRLGGTDRIGRIVAEFPSLPSPDELLDSLHPLPERWMVGLSAVGMGSDFRLKSFATDLKKAARARDSKLKFVLPQSGFRLNAAQVLFNNLTKEPNREIALLKTAAGYSVVTTEQVQDIQAYELRDTARPARNARAGMLPPKLAQIMLNLALEKLSGDDSISVYDPFCGSGTVLQEGWLRGLTMYGSDASADAVEASERNLGWLAEHFPVGDPAPTLWRHNVRAPLSDDLLETFSAVVTEADLGTPHSSLPTRSEAQKQLTDKQALYTDFFSQLRPFLIDDGVIVVAFPTIKTGRERWETLALSWLDEVEQIGYRKDQLVPAALGDFFAPSERGSLRYARPDAVVGRELFRFSCVSS